MKTIAEIRRNNLRDLSQKYPTQDAFAEAIGKLSVQVSHTIKKSRKTGTYIRNIGDKFARDVERALRLPHLWMDEDHDESLDRCKDATVQVQPDDLMLLNKLKELDTEEKLVVIAVIDEKIKLKKTDRLHRRIRELEEELESLRKEEIIEAEVIEEEVESLPKK